MVLRSGSIAIPTKEGPGGAQVPQTIAYCDQRPWIVNATVEDNICFGQPYDEAKMQVRATCANFNPNPNPCALRPIRQRSTNNRATRRCIIIIIIIIIMTLVSKHTP